MRLRILETRQYLAAGLRHRVKLRRTWVKLQIRYLTLPTGKFGKIGRANDQPIIQLIARSAPRLKM